MTTRKVVIAAVFAAGLLTGGMLNRLGIGQPAPVPAPSLPAPLTPEGQNGLSENERAAFYHLSEGGELFPVDWLLALEVESLAGDGTLQVRPFLDNIERYGLLTDPVRRGNPDGLPVGVSIARAKAEQVDMIGLNCAACHVGQVQYRGHAVRIDGLGNMALINAFLVDMATETDKTLRSPRRLVRFWKRVRAVRASRRARGMEAGVVAEDERPIRGLLSLLTTNRDMLDARIATLKNVASLKNSLRISTQEGYGRLDAFGIGRDELFGSVPGNSLPANAPVSFPHIWGVEYTGWLQWGANTNSVMERNIGQALGVGALVDSKTFASTLEIENLHRMEQFAYRLTPPAWPGSFPAIDTARANEGKVLFVQYCAHCHEKYTSDGRMRTYQLFPFTETGTDPLAAINFELPVMQPDGQVRPFPYAARDLISKIKLKAYQDAGYSAEKIAEVEERQIRKGPQWDPTFRAPLLDSAKYPDTAGRKVYRAKTLVGIWATAPFLHNGSVPTIYDLLSPAGSRPIAFPTGTREYDPVKLGVQIDPSQYALAPGQAPFTFDTRLPGNWNTGHEWQFYPELDDAARYAIIEFLKTFTSESVLAAAPAAAAAPPARAEAGEAESPAAFAPGNVAVPSGLHLRGLLILGVIGLPFAFIAARIANGVMPHGEAARATEAADIAALTQDILTIQQRYAAAQNRPLARGTHAKGLCLRGEFEVFDVFQTIPDRALAGRLAHGIFARPGVHPATVRFANADSHIFPDPKKDVRACSFSVEVGPGVIGPAAARQDFSMNNAATFPINDAHAFAVTTRVATAPTIAKGFRSLPFRDKLEFVRVAVLGARQEKPASRAYQQMAYWSTVPYHHGPADVVKYAVFPCAGNYAMPLGSGINCLQDELLRHLNEDLQMSCFDFGLQLLDVDKQTYWGRRRSATFWIENASVEWKASQAPFHTVGRLTLVAKSAFPAEACAQMSIDVTGNSAPDCKPVGSINRARPVAEGASRNARLRASSTPPAPGNAPR